MEWGAASKHETPLMPSYGQQYPEGSVGYEAAKYWGNVSYNNPYQNTYNFGWQNQQNFGWGYEERAPMNLQNQFFDQNWQPQKNNEYEPESSSSIEALLEEYIKKQEIRIQQIQMDTHEAESDLYCESRFCNIPPETYLESTEHNFDEGFEGAEFEDEPEEKLETELGIPEILSEKSIEIGEHEEIVQSKESYGFVLEVELEKDKPSDPVDSPYMIPSEVLDNQEKKNSTWKIAESESFFLEEPLQWFQHQFPPISRQQTLIMFSYPALQRIHNGWLGLRDVGKLFQFNPG